MKAWRKRAKLWKRDEENSLTNLIHCQISGRKWKRNGIRFGAACYGHEHAATCM